jgi:hypothetical protein
VYELLTGRVERIGEEKYIQKLKTEIEKLRDHFKKNRHEMDMNISLDFKRIEK